MNSAWAQADAVLKSPRLACVLYRLLSKATLTNHFSLSAGRIDVLSTRVLFRPPSPNSLSSIRLTRQIKVNLLSRIFHGVLYRWLDVLFVFEDAMLSTRVYVLREYMCVFLLPLSSSPLCIPIFHLFCLSELFRRSQILLASSFCEPLLTKKIQAAQVAKRASGIHASTPVTFLINWGGGMNADILMNSGLLTSKRVVRFELNEKKNGHVRFLSSIVSYLKLTHGFFQLLRNMCNGASLPSSLSLSYPC